MLRIFIFAVIAVCSAVGVGCQGIGDDSAEDTRHEYQLPISTAESSIDEELGEQSIMATYPRMPIQPISYEAQEAVEDPVCIFQKASRIAVVTIDAIVRDYGDPNVNENFWTVYRLKVHQILKGGYLNETIYAGVVTGCLNCGTDVRPGVPGAQDYSYPTAERKVGERGVAMLFQLGRDPIRVVGLSSESTDQRIVPARVMSFAIFLPEKENGKLDSGRENSDLLRLTGGEITYKGLEFMISRIGKLESCVYGGPTTCHSCDTSEECFEFEPEPCRCVANYTNCRELPPEDPERCRLFEPVSE